MADQQMTTRERPRADDDQKDGIVAKGKTLVERVLALRPVRVFLGYSSKQGPLLASGMAFQALFAIFAAIWVGFSIAGIFIASNAELVGQIVDLINNSVPGLIGTGDDSVISTTTLLSASSTLSWTGIVALAGLLWTAIGWLSTTRSAIRIVFGVPQLSSPFVLQKVRDLGLAALFGLLLIASAVVSLVISAAAQYLLDLAGLPKTSIGAQIVAHLLSILVSALVNMVALGGMYRLLSRVAIPFRRLAVGALIGAVGLTVLSQASGLLLGGSSKNPLLASFAVIIGLLIWFNLVCQVILIAASWIAVGMEDAGIPPIRLSAEEREKQRIAEEREARLTLASTAVEEAQQKVSEASRFTRWRARQRLEKAQRELDELRRDQDRAAT